MRVCVIFYNLGGYHLARLAAAANNCTQHGWDFSAIEVTRSTSEHPWGMIERPEFVTTLMEFQAGDAPSLPDANLLESALDRIAPDVVAIPGWGHDFARVALRWVRRMGKTSILMCESKHDDSPRQWHRELAKKWLYVRHFDAAIVGGSKHRDYLVRLGMARNRIFGGYNVVDNDHFISETDKIRSNAQEANTLTSKIDRPFFLSSNRFIGRKNLRFLIDSFAAYWHQACPHKRLDLVLLGDGELKESLHALAVEKGLGNAIHFPGFVSYKQLCNWYAAASVFVHPALSEQWGLVVNEAMAAGIPTLVSNACGCVPDLVIDGETGFTFNPTNPEELVEKMLAVSESGSLRVSLGTAARQHVVRSFGANEFGRGLVSSIGSTQP